MQGFFSQKRVLTVNAVLNIFSTFVTWFISMLNILQHHKKDPAAEIDTGRATLPIYDKMSNSFRFSCLPVNEHKAKH